MSDHFSLDVDPEQLRAAARSLGQLGEHLSEKGRATKDTPAAIGDEWTGDAATTVKAEMTGLGEHMTGFTKDFETSAEALRSLATDYEDSLTQVEDLNKKWQAAEDDYQVAKDDADRSFERTRDHGGPGGKPLPGGLRHEIESSRTYAYGQAADDRRTAQHNLEYSFGMTKQWLAQQTRNAGQSLVDAAPMQVTAEQVTAWKGSGTYPARLDRDGLLGTMAMTAEREQEELERIEQERRDEAEADVKEDLEELNGLLDDNPADPEELRDKLAEIGENADDAYYSEALVDELGAEGLNDLYDDIGEQVPTYYEVEEVWPGLEKFNDVIANGLAQYDDGELNDFTEQFMGYDQGPKRWALFTDSDYADGRTNAIATTYFNRVYTHDMSNPSGFDPFTSMFNLAYGDDDMLEQWEEHSSAADFSALVSAASPEQREKLLQELTQIGAYPQMSREEWQYKARLFGGTLQHLVAGGRENADAVELFLQYMHAPHDTFYQEDLLPYVADALDDPAAMSWIIHDVRFGGMDADVLTDAMQRVDVDVDQLVSNMIDYQLANDIHESKLADDIGYLLGTEDLLGQTISPEGVITSLLGSTVGAVSKHPLPGAVLGVFTALYDEMAEMEANEEAWAEGWENEEPHRLLSFLIYTKAHGEPPGFQGWLEENGRENDPDAVIDFIQDEEIANTQLFQDLDALREDIDEARDEE